MAWTSPRTWVSGAVVTAAQLNQHLRDNLLALRAGDVEALDAGKITSGTIDAARLPEISMIRRIQTGTLSRGAGTGNAITFAQASITAVNTAKAIVLDIGSELGNQTGRLELTNATTVRAYARNSITINKAFVVVEYM